MLTRPVGRKTLFATYPGAGRARGLANAACRHAQRTGVASGLEAILQRVELTLIDSNAIGGQLLPLLPLRDLQTTTLPVAAPASVEEAPEGGE